MKKPINIGPCIEIGYFAALLVAIWFAVIVSAKNSRERHEQIMRVLTELVQTSKGVKANENRDNCNEK